MNTHRWRRATTEDPEWGALCTCGNLKTDQALTCTECAAERRRAPDYWERRTCVECGGPRASRRLPRGRCRLCANAALIGAPHSGKVQPADHPWRKLTVKRIAQQSLLA